MDSILLSNIAVRTRIGVPDEERENAQEVFVTIEIFHPLESTAKSDALAEGIDYAEITAAIVSLAGIERKTIERFAEDIASAILKKFKPQGGVRITVTKKPMLPLESASITITRP